MTDTLIIAESEPADTGYRFSWGLAIAGGVVATAVTFFLLTLGAGAGLALVDPVYGSAPSAPVALNAGAIYFLFAQAFGFVVGGHLTGMLLGAVTETRRQEDQRAATHGLVAWATAVLATLTMVALTGLSASNTASTAAALYGASTAQQADAGGEYAVDRLFDTGGAATAVDASSPRDEAARIVVNAMPSLSLARQADRSRLVSLVSRATGLPADQAEGRISALEAEMRQTADAARQTTAYGSLWIALSLLVGAILAMLASIMARHEDNRRSIVAPRQVTT